MVGCSLTFAKLEWRWCGFYLWCFQSWKDRERERQTVDAKLSWIQGPAAQSGKPSPSWGMLVAFLLFAFREAYHLRSRIFFVIPWKNWHVGQRSPTIFSKYPQLKLCLNYTFTFHLLTTKVLEPSHPVHPDMGMPSAHQLIGTGWTWWCRKEEKRGNKTIWKSSPQVDFK